MSADGPPRGARPPGGGERSELRGDVTADGPPRGARPPGGGERSELRGDVTPATADERPRDLDGWLARLEALKPERIVLGLERVRAVLERLDATPDAPVLTVAGTNGKGSTCAMLEAVLRAAGYRTGLYTSPHLARYAERVRIDGREADAAAFVDAFGIVEDARVAAGSVPLTYFEFGTLAALVLFARARPDALVLEVGLGGRLDAVNAVDADVAIVTSVDLDHEAFLGNTRELIGREKAGVYRRGRVAVCGDADPPASLVAHAAAIGATLLVRGRDFDAVDEGAQWRYRGPGGDRYGLPKPALRGDYQLGNAACAIAALDALKPRLPVDGGALRAGLVGVELPGRFQVLPGRPARVLDVAHNPQAARALARTLGTMGYFPRTIAVAAMLGDKDVDAVVAALAGSVERWHVAPLPPPRGAPADRIAAALAGAGVAADRVTAHDGVAAAWRAARVEALDADRILAFGSFLTIAAVLDAERADRGSG